MEQILTTAALIAGGIFAVWILFSDPGGEDGKGETNTALLGALLMIPVIILLLIGIVLFLPVLLGIVLVIFLAYAIYRALRWLLTREREEKPDQQEEGKIYKGVRGLFYFFKGSADRLWNSRPLRMRRERMRTKTEPAEEAVKDTGKSLKHRVVQTFKGIREHGPKRARETIRTLRPSDAESGKLYKSIGDVFRKSKERIARSRASLSRQSSRRRAGNRSGEGALSFAVSDVEDETRSSRREAQALRDRQMLSIGDDVQRESGVFGRQEFATSASGNKQTSREDSWRGDHASAPNGSSATQQQESSEKLSLGRRLQRWRSALQKKTGLKNIAEDAAAQPKSLHRTVSKSAEKHRTTFKRPQAHDPLQNMRNIGWNTRKHLGEVHHRRK